MTTITAGMVKDLRDKTGAGMMDCKAALGETKGDLEAAVDWLRKKGLAKAAKKSGRVAAEGLIAAALAGNRGVLVEVNSETDFVARNEQFQTLVRNVAAAALEVQSGDVQAISAAPIASGGTVMEAVTAAIATVGENMTFRRAGYLAVDAGAVVSYIHNQIADNLGRIGVLVALESKGAVDKLMAFGRDLAKHIAASSPLAIDPTGLAADVVAREKAILAEKHVGKPAHVMEKIVESGLKTYYKEVCLLEQSYIHDDAKTVAQALKDFEKGLGAPVALKGYHRFALGEGIEKEAGDFAAEVAAAIKS